MDKRLPINGKKATILGAARSGLAAARLLKHKDFEVFVSDRAAAGQKEEALRFLQREQIAHEFGEHSERAFQADFCVLSPGIPVASPVVQQMCKRNIPVVSEIEVAYWFYPGKLIAVTGSNGKTTTTTLIGEMLKRRDGRAIVAGNIGQPFSDFVEESQNDTWGVVEVSSFQLETIDTFHPQQAVLLNFAPNHLDRYASYEDYMAAKWRITKNLTEEDRFIYNGHDAEILKRVAHLNCQKSAFHIAGDTQAEIYFKDGEIIFQNRLFLKTEEMALHGLHNYMNAMAAILAAHYAGVEEEDIRQVLRQFKGVEHRLEFVREINGIRFINDSKATTVESLYYALQSFDQPIVLIAGGKDKGSDFSRLNEQIAQKVKAVVLIGSATEKMHQAWQGIKPLFRANTLKDAVNQAYRLAETGDVVLLSPACASFDMFDDFEDRGRQFKQIVNELREA